MSTRDDNFIRVEIRMRAVDIAADSLEKQLIVAQFLSQLDKELYNRDEARNLLRALKGRSEGLLHDFKNVLLRFADPKKWRDFVRATCERKEGSEVGKIFHKLLADNADFCLDDPTSLDAHPVKEAMRNASNDALGKLQERADAVGDIENAETENWGEFLRRFENVIFKAATREWLCRSTSRALNEKS
jgi:hypothetical protein